MRRVLKADPDSDTGVEVTDRAVRIAGSQNNFLFADGDGLALVGPLSILAAPDQIRIASIYRFSGAYDLALPSTIVTPSPVLVPSSPVSGFASIASQAAELLAQVP